MLKAYSNSFIISKYLNLSDYAFYYLVKCVHHAFVPQDRNPLKVAELMQGTGALTVPLFAPDDLMT